MNKANNDLLFCPGLRWLPWIGKEYFNGERRLLIVGESHYLTGSEKNRLEAEQPDFTRNVIQTFCVDNKKPQPTFDNLNRCLLDKQKVSAQERAELWKHLAFYNFVQRPMKSNTNRPTVKDMEKGWQVFSDLIKALRPTECIFIGVAAADSSHNPYKCTRSEKVGNVAPRSFTVQLDEQLSVLCVAIKHTSHHFSWKEWRNFLKNHHFLF